MTIEDNSELSAALERMREAGTDLSQWEVKSAAGGFPTSIPDTMAAFANTHGGTIILGISETGFMPADGFEPATAQTFLAEAARNRVTPALTPDIHVLTYKARPVVVANIPELPARMKPCYVRKHGQVNGSYIRTGDGDHRLTMYELDRFRENQFTNAAYDSTAVAGAHESDLDPQLRNSWLMRVRSTSFGRLENAEEAKILRDHRILEEDAENVVRPSLAGLLALGSFPQKYYPRLNVAFAAYPTNTKGELSEGKFVDRATIEGSIPAMILATLRAIARNMRQSSTMSGALRVDRWDYPLPALREAIANALMHRDYSPEAWGTPVSVDLFPNRIEITSPGGLYGPIDVASLGQPGATASRNQFLARILEDTPYTDIDGLSGTVVENPGSGYPIITSELAKAQMPPPEIHSTLNSFTMTFRKKPAAKKRSSASSSRAAIIECLKSNGPARTAEIAAATMLSSRTVLSHLNALIEEGLVNAEGNTFSPKRTYRVD